MPTYLEVGNGAFILPVVVLLDDTGMMAKWRCSCISNAYEKQIAYVTRDCALLYTHTHKKKNNNRKSTSSLLVMSLRSYSPNANFRTSLATSFTASTAS